MWTIDLPRPERSSSSARFRAILQTTPLQPDPASRDATGTGRVAVILGRSPRFLPAHVPAADVQRQQVHQAARQDRSAANIWMTRKGAAGAAGRGAMTRITAAASLFLLTSSKMLRRSCGSTATRPTMPPTVVRKGCSKGQGADERGRPPCAGEDIIGQSRPMPNLRPTSPAWTAAMDRSEAGPDHRSNSAARTGGAYDIPSGDWPTRSNRRSASAGPGRDETLGSEFAHENSGWKRSTAPGPNRV